MTTTAATTSGEGGEELEINYFNSKNYHQSSSTFPKYVQIMSIEDTSSSITTTIEQDIPICISANKLEIGSKLITQACDISDTLQLFHIDIDNKNDNGQIHMYDDESMCITKSGKKGLVINKCPKDSNDKDSKFIFQSVGLKMNAEVFEILLKRINKTFVVVSTTRDSQEVVLSSSDDKIIMKEWILVYSPNLQSDQAYTYIPGLLTVEENGLVMSSGLTSRVIAKSNKLVKYSNGNVSKSKYHRKPDGAAVFSVKRGHNSGG